MDRGGYEGFTYNVNHPERIHRVADKVTEVDPNAPIKLRQKNLQDTDVENAVQR